MIVWPCIAPTEVLPYGINWAPRLGTDTIVTSVWSASVPPGLTLTNKANTASATSVTISGAVLNVTYTIVNTITTTLSCTEVETVQITCAPK